MLPLEAREGDQHPRCIHSVPSITVDAQEEPQHFVGGQFFSHLVQLQCERCARKNVVTVLGRALTKDGLTYFHRKENARKLKAVVGFPELDRMGDGRVKMRSNWMPVDVVGHGFELACPDCKAKPTVNAYALAHVVGNSIAASSHSLHGVPILIDPFGGFALVAESLENHDGERVEGSD